MSSIIPGYEYDIFISYRQKDNKGDKWVSEFVEALKTELESTFKEEISIYFDINPHDGLLETHDVDASLKEKLKCLVFIPIISRTYCDPKSFAWEHEFKAFVNLALQDQFGLKVKLPNGNVANRVLPIRIHDLDADDVKLFEKSISGIMRTLDFVFRTASGVNRSLKSKEDHPGENLAKTYYQDQINKVALAIKEIIQGMKAQPVQSVKEKDKPEESLKEVKEIELKTDLKKPDISGKHKLISTVAVVALLIIVGIIAYPKIFKQDTLENLRAKGKIVVAVMPFQNMTNDTTWNVWQDGIQNNIITSLSNNPEELNVRQMESINSILQSKGLTNYASITSSIASTISKKLDANVYISGSINQSGTTIRVNASLINTKTEEIFRSFQINGTAENILPIIDSLSLEVKNSLLISKLGREVTRDFQPYGATTSSEAYRNFIYGQNAFMKLDYPTAISFFTKALEIDSNFIYSSYLLAFAYSFTGKTDRAKEIAFKNHMKRDKISSQFFKIMTDYQYAYFFETLFEQMKYIRQSMQRDDQIPFSNHNLGGVYNILYQYDKAIPEFIKALEIYEKWGVKPAWIHNYTYLGYAYHKTGQYRKEKQLYKKAELDYPNDINLLFRQAVLALSEGDTIAANQYIEKYITIRKENSASEAAILTNLAGIYFDANLYDKAEKYYRKAISSEPDNPSRMNNLAYFLINTDRNTNEGLEVVNTALKSEPDNYNYLHTKGWGLYKQGKYEEALALLQKSWDLRRKLATYNHEAFLHLEEAKKAVGRQK